MGYWRESSILLVEDESSSFPQSFPWLRGIVVSHYCFPRGSHWNQERTGLLIANVSTDPPLALLWHHHNMGVQKWVPHYCLGGVAGRLHMESLLIPWSWLQTAHPCVDESPGILLSFSDTIPVVGLGCHFTALPEWNSRLLTRLLLVWVMVGPCSFLWC